MNKYFYCLIAIVLLFACTHSTNLNAHPDYAVFYGKEYKIKVDLIIVKYDDNNKRYVLDFPGKLDIPNLKPSQSFPFKSNETTIYGILPAGAVLKVTNIQRTNSIEWNMIDYYVTVESSGAFHGYTLFALMLTDMNAKPVPQLSSKYVEEIKPVR
jgi:hypothetical protein